MDEIAKRFAELAERYGPNVVDASLGAARTEAISTLIGGVMALSIALALFKLSARLRRSGKATNSDDKDLWFIGGGITWIGAAIAVYAGTWMLIDPWTWTALTHPELWIAKRVLGL